LKNDGLGSERTACQNGLLMMVVASPIMSVLQRLQERSVAAEH